MPWWDPELAPALEAYTAAILPSRTEDLTGLCPAFVLVGGNDPLRDEAVEYAWRLMRSGVTTELHVVPGLSHAFDLLAPDSAATRSADRLMAAALHRASSSRD